MIRALSVCLVTGLAGAAIFVFLSEPSKSATVKRQVEQMVEAMIQGDSRKLVDDTYEPVVELIGGRDRAIKMTAEAIKRAKAEGLLINVEVGEPGEFIVGDGKEFVVVPTRMIIPAHGKEIAMNSFQLGVSTDSGKTWKYVDSDNFARYKDKLFPRLPEKLKSLGSRSVDLFPRK
jgi:hypothetical protein